MLMQWSIKRGWLFFPALWMVLTILAHAQNPASAESVKHPYPPGDKGDIWLLGGQSNMNGNGRMEEEVKPDPRVLFFARNIDQWVIAKEPLGRLFFPDHPDPNPPDYTHLPVGGAGLGLRFAKRVIQVTHRPLGMIGVQWGQPMTKVWDPPLMDNGQTPPKPYLYGPMIQRVIQAGGYGKLKGMIWYQGESDAVQYPQASKVFEKNLETFIDRERYVKRILPASG